eukprot:UN05752
MMVIPDIMGCDIKDRDGSRLKEITNYYRRKMGTKNMMVCISRWIRDKKLVAEPKVLAFYKPKPPVDDNIQNTLMVSLKLHNKLFLPTSFDDLTLPAVHELLKCFVLVFNR